MKSIASILEKEGDILKLYRRNIDLMINPEVIKSFEHEIQRLKQRVDSMVFYISKPGNNGRGNRLVMNQVEANKNQTKEIKNLFGNEEKNDILGNLKKQAHKLRNHMNWNK